MTSVAPADGFPEAAAEHNASSTLPKGKKKSLGPSMSSVAPAGNGPPDNKASTRQRESNFEKGILLLPMVAVLCGVIGLLVILFGRDDGGETVHTDDGGGSGGGVLPPQTPVVECPEGFENVEEFNTGFDCADINECTLGTANCTRSQWCINIPGSFSCVECPNGRIAGDGGRTCIVDVLKEDMAEARRSYECPPGSDTGNAMHTLLMDASSSVEGSFSDEMDINARFGTSVTALGDMDGDGVNDIAVSAWMDSGGGVERGAVYTLLLNADGTVRHEQKISSVDGGMEHRILDFEKFGKSIAGVGDIDGDGVGDLLVASHAPEALYVLFLEPTGFVKGEFKISSLTVGLNQGDDFGRRSMVSMGDIDQDGVVDIAVGGPDADEGRGAVYLIFLNGDGSVKNERKVGFTSSQLSEELDPGDGFGISMAPIGDMDGNGVVDIAVGSAFDDDGGNDKGAVYVLFLNPDWTVKAKQKISSTQGGLMGPLHPGDGFGHVGKAGDLDGDGVVDLLVGAPLDQDDTVLGAGALYVVLLNADGTVKEERKLSRRHQGLTTLKAHDFFGLSSTSVGHPADGVMQLAIGVPGRSQKLEWDSSLETHREQQVVRDQSAGALYMVQIHACTTPLDIDECVLGRHDCPRNTHMCSNTVGSFDCIACDTGFVSSDDGLGCVSHDSLIDDCARGLHDCAPHLACTNSEPGFECVACDLGEVVSPDGLSCIKDVCWSPDPYEGVCDVVELCKSTGGASFECRDFCTRPGRLQAGIRKVSYNSGGLVGPVRLRDQFGSAVAGLGDLDGDGVPDLAVGAPGDDDGARNGGAVYIVFPNPDRTVKAENKILGSSGADYFFGAVVGSVGDVDGDGVVDLAVGAEFDDDGGTDRGVVTIVFLTVKGERKNEVKITSIKGGLQPLEDGARFGAGVGAVGDLDGDGVVDLAVGSVVGDDGRGGVHVLFLTREGGVKAEKKINSSHGGLVASLEVDKHFGRVSGVGDLNGDGIMDLGVGADFCDTGGCLYLLLLNRDGTVLGEHVISSTIGGLTGPLKAGAMFGTSVVPVGDLNKDGVLDLAVSARGGGTAQTGAMYILLMNPDYTVKGEQVINGRQVDGELANDNIFGSGIVNEGDRDGDGVVDLVVGAGKATGGSKTWRGAIYFLGVPRGYVAECPWS